jgi:hypothetical protein
MIAMPAPPAGRRGGAVGPVVRETTTSPERKHWCGTATATTTRKEKQKAKTNTKNGQPARRSSRQQSRGDNLCNAQHYCEAPSPLNVLIIVKLYYY